LRSEPIDSILDFFPVEIDSSEELKIPFQKRNKSIYNISASCLLSSYEGDLYILDTNEGRDIAFKPHIVGGELGQKCKTLANDFIKVTRFLEDLGGKVGILHILRAGAGYMVHKAIEAPILRVRTQYTSEGYRDYLDNRKIEVTYRDYPDETPEKLIIPDTFATGRSAETAIKDLLQEGHSPEKIIYFGFIAIPALERISEICKNEQIDLSSYAICNITQLAHNNYDMPAYGLDESYYVNKGKRRKLGSIIPNSTLENFLPNYVPGMDQPGDWSERQPELYNGEYMEKGDIRKHLSKSISLIKKLQEISQDNEWYLPIMDEAAERELKALRNTLSNYD
jgi:uracil phosphoribosyltransferase